MSEGPPLPTIGARIVRAVEIAGECYGAIKTIGTLVTLFGEETQEEEDEILTKCDEAREKIIAVLDILEGLARRHIERY